MKPRYWIQTYGCQMNVHDSERMAGMLESLGLDATESPEEADVILLNTCAVRERPEHKLYSDLGRLRVLKHDKPDLVIGVAGCMAQREADSIRRRVPEVDILLGPRNLHHLPLLVRSAQNGGDPNGLGLDTDPTPVTPVRRSSATSAWVDVIFGCNFKCTYCAVPSARGREVSRRPSEVLDEIRQLSDLGYREITLLGQTVNAYGHDLGKLDDGTRLDFAWLLEQINAINPNFRVRFTSPHPMYFTETLVDAIADLPSVCEHLHLPLQSGDNACLKRMKRTYTVERYRSIIDRVRERIPGVTLTTDAIVGFCGESDEEFENTMQTFREIRFDQAFMFAYSPRHTTEAFDWTDDVPLLVKKERLNRLIDLQADISREKNGEMVGQRFEVLVEGPSDKDPLKIAGRTRGNKLMIFPGTSHDYPVGTLVEVEARDGFLWGFIGEAKRVLSPMPSVESPRVLMELQMAG
ncbi:tRNA-2-methylthio-N(6)-dimethylallyladenosine synthase [Abditibacteriota bacterium]|nr:tRNA-2-methylthio-N(6)-dimethylallyladenosine synthase [Abditibacteriota bacterium]